MYVRASLINLSKITVGSKSTEMKILICYILNISFVILYVASNPRHNTARYYITIDGIFSNKAIKTGIHISTFSCYMPLYSYIPISSIQIAVVG